MVWAVDFIIFLPVLYGVLKVLYTGMWYFSLRGEMSIGWRIFSVLFLLSCGVNLGEGGERSEPPKGFGVGAESEANVHRRGLGWGLILRPMLGPLLGLLCPIFI